MRSNVQPLFPDQETPQEAVGARFAELWALWPNKSKKPLARAKYLAILKGCKTRTLDKDSGQYMDIEIQATEAEIIDGCKKYLASQVDKNTYRLRDDGRFIPMLSTFLNGGRHEDYL